MLFLAIVKLLAIVETESGREELLKLCIVINCCKFFSTPINAIPPSFVRNAALLVAKIGNP